MYYDKDEFFVFSRTGRVPLTSRAGPRYRDRLAPHHRHYARTAGPGGGPPGRAFRPSRLWRMLRGAGRAGDEPARPASISGYADRETYLELEFAVGFGVQDEEWL